MAGVVYTIASLVLLVVLLTAPPAEGRRGNQVSGAASKHLQAAAATKHLQAGAASKHRRAGLAHRHRGPATRQGISFQTTTELITWKTVTYDFSDSPGLEQQLRDSGHYIPDNIIPFDFEVPNDDDIIISTPPLMEGVPATLGLVTDDFSLQPYPSWEAQGTSQDSIEDCSSMLVGIIRMTRIPHSETVYAVDVGKVNIAETPKVLCPPKVVAIDTESRSITSSTEITDTACNFLFSAIMVEESTEGTMFAYIADEAGFEMIVVNLDNGEQHRVRSQYFYPSPGFGITTIGVTAYSMRGVSSLALERKNEPYLYTNAFSSNKLGKIPTSSLKNAADAQILDYTEKVMVPGSRDTVSDAMFLQPSGQRLFFTQESAIFYWNTSAEYNPENFVLLTLDQNRLEYVSALKLDEYSDQLWFLSNRYPRFLQGKIDTNAINYRLMYIDLSSLL